jgi:DNA ligase (NAD+)
MYSKETTKEFQKLTTDLVKKQKAGSITKKDVTHLADILRFHEYRYYILNDPLLADYEYDQLYKALEKIEAENPSLVSPDSPTQRVAKGLTKDFPTAQHLVPMLSLDNSYNNDDIVDFDRKARELTKLDKLEYCVEPKFDGGSISLVYENDYLVRGATRGDGVEGDEVTANIKQIRSLPLSAKFSKYGLQSVEIRGEVLINKTNFAKYNQQLVEQGLAPLANPRNAAAGTLRIKDPNEARRRNLEAFVYHVSYYTLLKGKKVPTEMTTHSGSLEMLWDLGFRSPQKEKKVFKGMLGHCMQIQSETGHEQIIECRIPGGKNGIDHTRCQDTTSGYWWCNCFFHFFIQ